MEILLTNLTIVTVERAQIVRANSEEMAAPLCWQKLNE
jgi:hypothetical protein